MLRICLECNDTNKLIDLEYKTSENLKVQGTPKVFNKKKKKRSAKLYLNMQPAFKHVIFNKKGTF